MYTNFYLFTETEQRATFSKYMSCDEYFNQLRIIMQLQMSHNLSYRLLSQEDVGSHMILRFLKPGWFIWYVHLNVTE